MMKLWKIKSSIKDYLDRRSLHSKYVREERRMHKYIRLAKKAKLPLPGQRYARFMILHGGPGDNDCSRKTYREYLKKCKLDVERFPHLFKHDSNLAGFDRV